MILARTTMGFAILSSCRFQAKRPKDASSFILPASALLPRSLHPRFSLISRRLRITLLSLLLRLLGFAWTRCCWWWRLSLWRRGLRLNSGPLGDVRFGRRRQCDLLEFRRRICQGRCGVSLALVFGFGCQ